MNKERRWRANANCEGVMSTVYFTTPTILDLNFVRIMGVSVKTGSNPIGYFGTGLKFAIATLLRNKQKIELSVCGERYSFGTKNVEIRGEAFEVVTLNGEELSFTTQLGRNWKLWQAYRELHSNTLDECGEISSVKQPAQKVQTVIMVTGDQFFKEYEDRGDTFISGTPIFTSPGLDIYSGPSVHGYYRGVRAHELPKPSRFRFNVKSKLELTEDRNVKSSWDFDYAVATGAIRTENPSTAFGLMFCDYFEGITKYAEGCMSDVFLKCALANRNNSQVAEHYARKAEELGMIDPINDLPCELTKIEREMFDRACAIVRGIGFDTSGIKIVKHINGNAYGMFSPKTGDIFISKDAFDMGDNFLASTILEECTHKYKGFSDCTRDLQNWLFNKVVVFAREAGVV